MESEGATMLTPKRIIMFGAIIGSTVGGWAPTLWGSSGFSMSAMLLSIVGGLLGIWAGVKLADRF
jgi:uncharacterized membrane protein YeaQ/YmgE (transglycosylase-associated protein family)